MRRRTLHGLEDKVFTVEMEKHALDEWARTASNEEFHAFCITGGSFVLTKEVTMASSAFKNYRPVMQELERQGWELEQTANGHWRCVPPDKTKSIVHFACSDEPRAMDNAIAELRTSGFVWPPSSKTELRADRGTGAGRREKAPLTQRLDLSGVTLVEDGSNGATVPAPPPSDEVLLPNETQEERMDRVIQELKEAKSYLTLTGEVRADAKKVLEDAQAAFDAAQTEYIKAGRTLQSKKDAFDKVFSADSAA